MTKRAPTAPAAPVHIGWQLVEHAGKVELKLLSPSSNPGELIASYWATGMTAYDFRRCYGGDQEGEPDTLPMPVEYLDPGLYRQIAAPCRQFRVSTGQLASRLTLQAVEKDLRRGGAQAEWRWDNVWGCWQRYYPRDGWRSVDRILGPERPVPPADLNS